MVSALEFKPHLYDTAAERLQERFDKAEPGSTVEIPPGVYRGNFVVRESIHIVGQENAILDGMGRGSVLVLDAPKITVSGLTIRNSGENLVDEDSGIFVTKKGTGVVIANNILENNSFGIWVNGATDVEIKDNYIVGKWKLISVKRGNGIQLWDADGSLVYNNTIVKARDGIYLSVADRVRLYNNTIRELRYGVHFMYSNDCFVTGTISSGNRAGLALMFSRNLKVKNNVAVNNTEYGILFRDVQASDIENNFISGAEKGLFLYNSLYNNIIGNIIENNLIGVHVWAGSVRNNVSGNYFIFNRIQVKYVGAYDVEWNGNYWSDYVGVDMDRDGIGDTPHRPIDIINVVFWKYPQSKLLIASPAVQTLRILASRMPLLVPPGVVDRSPILSLRESSGG
jgi:nitrous oxidase accessory protein